MSAYSRGTIDSENYQKYRLTYPKSLYDAIVAYHSGRKNRALDIGCGTGLGTFPLLNHFDEVTGCDPSAKMLEAAQIEKGRLPNSLQGRIIFEKVLGEDLADRFASNSIDLICGGESIQYVDFKKFFEAVHKTLRPGGTLAFWFYADPVFVNNLKATQIFKNFCYEDGRYFQSVLPSQIEIIRCLGQNIEIPKSMFENIVSEVNYPGTSGRGSTQFRITKWFSLQDLRNFMSTWGYYQNWLEQNKGNCEDIIEVLMKKLKSECGFKEEKTYELEWETSYYLARKKASI
ncbi:LAMI_0C00188g1_1 [Lachancea mirantina]|uniref:LAMI_0C00188g1_1 n=1 Tax=Lachancea mirantina TaxID=1230905 RepID=A0A1G4IZK1_9SACH|nr:LAMI_0C00188g1_1 [Lachancea mirantina]